MNNDFSIEENLKYCTTFYSGNSGLYTQKLMVLFALGHSVGNLLWKKHLSFQCQARPFITVRPHDGYRRSLSFRLDPESAQQNKYGKFFFYFVLHTLFV